MKITMVIIAGVLLLTLGEAKPKPESPPVCLYRGAIYNDKETFKDNCNTCRCRKGKVACTKMLCAPCPYIGSDGSKMLAYESSYNDGCNTCGCDNGKTTFCTYMYCPHKCQVTNSEGHSGWVDIGTVIIRDAEEEGGKPQVCTCKSSAPQYLGYSGLVCE